jgi:hypothetical protein
MSVISLPANQQTILLDHLKKEATVIPMMPAAGSQGSAGGSGPQGLAPQAPHGREGWFSARKLTKRPLALSVQTAEN